MKTPRHEIIRQARELGLVEMKVDTGSWGLTKQGRDFLDMLDLLRLLRQLDRPGTVRASSPRRQAQPARSSRTANAPDGQRQGDDARRGEGRKGQGS